MLLNIKLIMYNSVVWNNVIYVLEIRFCKNKTGSKIVEYLKEEYQAKVEGI